MSHAYYLSLPIPPLRPDYVLPTDKAVATTLPHVPWVLPNEDFLNPVLVKYFGMRGIHLQRCHLFVLKPGGRSIIHKDGQKGGRNPIWAINWTLDGLTTDMSWFRLKPEHAGFEPVRRNAENNGNGGAGGEQYPMEVLELAQRACFTGPTLVRIDVPHQVVNDTNQLRWCVSIREGNGRSWEEITESLSDLILG